MTYRTVSVNAVLSDNIVEVSPSLSGNILAGKNILGVPGGLTVPTVSQDSTTKILTIR